jgi:anti-sigma regulatory factor (Ser/Thr protein kinase)
MITDTAARSLCWRLSRDPAQVKHARKQAREALSRWNLAEHADLAELIVSELATNAIRHGDGIVLVCLSFAHCDLRVEVHDGAAGRSPARRHAAAEDESGRGLALLDGLIALRGGCRGVTHDSTGRRKTVYVNICLAAERAEPVTGGRAACAATANRHHASRPPRPGGRHHLAACDPALRPVTCQHTPRCPGADTPDRQAAQVIAFHPEQGWSLLCNGVVAFEDSGALLPDGTAIETPRPASQSSANGLLHKHAPAGYTVPHGRANRRNAPAVVHQHGRSDHPGWRESRAPRRAVAAICQRQVTAPHRDWPVRRASGWLSG